MSSEDVHFLAHRSLQQELIPRWIQEKQDDLSGLIEASAFGRTPRAIARQALGALNLQTGDLFADFGSGPGDVLEELRGLNIQGIGYERNPYLVSHSRGRLENLGMNNVEIQELDFLQCEWPNITKAYATTARFNDEILLKLAERVTACESISQMVTLGRTLPLRNGWSETILGSLPLVWNRGEATITESLTFWQRE